MERGPYARCREAPELKRIQVSQDSGDHHLMTKKPQNEQDSYGLRYAEFAVPLVKSTQELYELVKAQEQMLMQQQQLLTQYNETLTKLTAKVQGLENQLDNKADRLFASKK